MGTPSSCEKLQNKLNSNNKIIALYVLVIHFLFLFYKNTKKTSRKIYRPAREWSSSRRHLHLYCCRRQATTSAHRNLKERPMTAALVVFSALILRREKNRQFQTFAAARFRSQRAAAGAARYGASAFWWHGVSVSQCEIFNVEKCSPNPSQPLDFLNYFRAGAASWWTRSHSQASKTNHCKNQRK